MWTGLPIHSQRPLEVNYFHLKVNLTESCSCSRVRAFPFFSVKSVGKNGKLRVARSTGVQRRVDGAVVRALASHQCGICGLSWLVVGSPLCSEGFSLGSPVFLPPQKPTFPNSNSVGNSEGQRFVVSNLLRVIFAFIPRTKEQKRTLTALSTLAVRKKK